MGKTVLQNRIEGWLEEAYVDRQLDKRITDEMLPKLAEAIEPVITQYIVKYGSRPNAKVFRTMVNNFAQDGPRVQALLKTRDSDEERYWQTLQSYFVRYAGRKWPRLASLDQKKIANRACRRMKRSLPSFLFLARFATWGSTALSVEYLRLERQIELKTT
ncbi:MAG: hypothetical protein ACPGWR_06510 [Ardenticatenaceae bacterium]